MSATTIYHVHHIIPRHMGGSNDRSNLVKLTIVEHAEAHRILFEQYRKKEDYIAWKSLSGQIGKEQLFIERSSIGGLNNRGKRLSEEHKKKIAKSVSVTCTLERRQAISKSMIGNTNSSNHNSDNYKKKQSEVMKLAWARRKNKVN